MMPSASISYILPSLCPLHLAPVGMEREAVWETEHLLLGCGVTPPTHSGTSWFPEVISAALALDSAEADLWAAFIFS